MSTTSSISSIVHIEKFLVLGETRIFSWRIHLRGGVILENVSILGSVCQPVLINSFHEGIWKQAAGTFIVSGGGGV